MSSVNDVLKQLYAQRKVKLRFKTINDRENFRQNIYKYKSVQDAAALAVLDETKQMLRYKAENFIVEDNCGGFVDYYATLWLEDKKEISFEIISVEENPAKDANVGRPEKKVSASLGEADSTSGQSSKSSDNLRTDDEKDKESGMERERSG